MQSYAARMLASRRGHALHGGRHWPWAICLALLVGLFWVPTPAAAKSLAQTFDVTQECFAAADENPEDGQDTLVRFNRTTGQTFPIGPTGTINIEAILFRADGVLLGADAGLLGTLDLSSGAFTTIGAFGTAGGAAGEIALNDVDSLGYDLGNEIYYGVHRRFGVTPDLLFAFDATTGAHRPDFFGPGIDYLPVEVIADPDDANRMLGDIDDIALDPVDGTLYAAVNNSGAGGVLATIDPTTGNVTPIATFHYPATNPANPALAGTVIDDMEGLAFLNDGQLYGSTGDNGPDADDLNKLFQIDKATGVGVLVGPFPTGQQDYEGLECLSFQAFIVLEKATNGPGQPPADADLPTGPAIGVGDTVTWTYTITNTAAFTLTDMVLTDDQEGQIGPGGASDCPPAGTLLPPGESLTCTLTGVAQLGQYANSATVTATTQLGVVFPRQTVTSTDPSHYVGVEAALGDYVWHDADGDGSQDEDEPPIPGVQVELIDLRSGTVVSTTTTDADGLYLFTSLPPGTDRYRLRFTPTEAATGFTTANQGDDSLDSDVDPATNETGPITLLPDALDTTWDAGLLCSNGGIVQGQLRFSGDNVDPGLLNNNAVLLLPQGDTPGDSIFKVTGRDGRFSFVNLSPGQYIVQLNDASLNAAGYIPTLESADSAFVTVEACLTTPVAYTYERPTEYGAVGDLVWYDTNANGVQDEWFDANGDGQVTKNMPGPDGELLSEYEWVDTNGDDSYTGPENEGELLKCGLNVIDSDLLTLYAADNLANPLASRGTELLGYYGFSAYPVGDTRARLTLGEPGWTVQLDAESEALLDAAQVMAATELCKPLPGLVSIGAASTNTASAAAVQPAAEPDDFACETALRQQATILTAENPIDLSLDFPIICTLIDVPGAPQAPVAIGDFVWDDTDKDGLQEQGEAGVPGITVQLFRDNFDAAPISTTTTSEAGLYSFTDLPPGTYCLAFALPEDFIPSPADAGDDDAVDSDGVQVIDDTSVRTACFNLPPGTTDITRDLGIFEDTTPTGEEPIDQPQQRNDREYLYLPNLNR